MIQTCVIVSKTESFYLFLLQSSVLCYKSNVGNKVQFLVVLLVVIEIEVSH